MSGPNNYFKIVSGGIERTFEFCDTVPESITDAWKACERTAHELNTTRARYSVWRSVAIVGPWTGKAPPIIGEYLPDEPGFIAADEAAE